MELIEQPDLRRQPPRLVVQEPGAASCASRRDTTGVLAGAYKPKAQASGKREPYKPEAQASGKLEPLKPEAQARFCLWPIFLSLIFLSSVLTSNRCPTPAASAKSGTFGTGFSPKVTGLPPIGTSPQPLATP